MLLSLRDRLILKTVRTRIKAKQKTSKRAKAKKPKLPPVAVKDLEKMKFLPAQYIEKYLGWKPWEGGGHATPGQIEILNAYALALKQQCERRDFEQQKLLENQLNAWKPGMTIKNVIRVEAGHGVGKLKFARPAQIISIF